ncbi:hypothetical protein [Streptomyces sp. NPDC007100]|uniref:hypothetical protein n=1 Tax=Streptomyces sp. NPDC007100 TaxID=3155602 RepID=UPI0033F9A8AE
MTPLERLLAEELPTGTFGDARPAAGRRRGETPKTSPADAARHLAELADAIGEPHLRAIPDRRAGRQTREAA